MEILYFAIAATGLVWGLVLLRYTGLFGACVALVPLAACFGFDFFHVDAGPLSLTADRLLLLGLCGVYVIYRGLGWTASPQLDRMDIVFGGFLAMLAFNTLMHDWQFNHSQPLINLVLLVFVPATVYWIVRESKFEQRSVQWLYGFLGVFSLYLAFTAVAEVKNLTALVVPRYITSSTYTEWVGRGRGPFLNPVTNGMYMIAGLCSWAMFWPSANRIGKALLGTAMFVVLLGVYSTLTRSCWLGAAASLGLIALAAMPRHWRPPVLIAGALAAVTVLAFKADRLNSFKRDVHVTEHEMAESAKLRPMLAIVAWKVTQDYPVFGCGYGLYRKVNIDYVHDPNIDYPLQRVRQFVQHNVLLSLLAETGFVGVSAYLLLLAGWLHRAWRVWNDPQLPSAMRQSGLLLAAFLVQWLIQGMFHDNNLMVNANLLLFLLAGVSQGVFARSREKADIPVRGSHLSSVRPGVPVSPAPFTHPNPAAIQGEFHVARH